MPPSPRRFTLKDLWYHDISLAVFTESCVYSNGNGKDINLDSHRGGASGHTF